MTRLAVPCCPQCGHELVEVRYPGGYLNRDQWESVRAGDFRCLRCPGNDRAYSNEHAYWWGREVIWPEATPETTCAVCGEQLREYHKHTVEEVIVQRDQARAERDAAIEAEKLVLKAIGDERDAALAVVKVVRQHAAPQIKHLLPISWHPLCDALSVYDAALKVLRK